MAPGVLCISGHIDPGNGSGFNDSGEDILYLFISPYDLDGHTGHFMSDR